MEPGKRLMSKVAIITGGAGGIGAATARLFARHGASVLLTDTDAAGGRTVESEITAVGSTAAFAEHDVRSEAQWTAIVAQAEQSWGRVDILCNIAGISGKPDIEPGQPGAPRVADYTLEHWNRVMGINATGVFLGTKTVVPAMIRAGGGSIVNLSSIYGLVGSFSNSAYHASKGAVRSFSRASAVQYAPESIRVNSIYPGYIATSLLTAGLSAELTRRRIAATPLARFGRPEDVANGCLYLASDEASWVTGSELVIDGGVTASV